MADKHNPSDPAGPSGRQPKKPRTIDVEASDVTPEASPETSAAADVPDEEAPSPPPAGRSSGGLKSMFGAAAVGAVAMLLLLVGLWFAGLIGNGGANGDRLASIEAQLNEIGGRAPPPRTGTNAKAIEDLTARIERVEKSSAALQPPLNDPALANRLTSAENATKAFSDNIGSLNGRVDDLSAVVRELRTRVEAAAPIDKADFDAMNARIAALEKGAGMMESEIGKRATITSDRAVRLALATSALRAQVERGEPFVGELAAAKPLAPDADFSALEPFAASGLPNPASLGRDLAALLPALRTAASASPADSGFLDRLKASASRLVRIRPVEDSASDDPPAVISRIESKAARNDIAGALEDFAKLPDAVRAPAQAWIDKAQARAKAIATSRQLAADAIGALGKAIP